MFSDNSADPKVDRWLRKQLRKVELALRYTIRGRFCPNTNHSLTPRSDGLFATLSPSEDEHAALRHARDIGAAMEWELGRT